jgi:hypothetical protein
VISVPKSQSFDDAEWELSFLGEQCNASYTARIKGVVAQDIMRDC